jgi:hypothetical protein
MSGVALVGCGDDSGDDSGATGFVTLSSESASDAAEAEGGSAEASSTSAEGEAAGSSGDGDGDGDAEGEAEAEAEEGTEGEETGEAGLSCEECWMLHCSDERSACEAATDCACVLECVEGGGSQGQCKNECGVQGSDEVWNAWNDCLDVNCSGAC